MSAIQMKNIFSRRQMLRGIMGGSMVGVAGSLLTACSSAGPTYYTLSTVSGSVYRINPSIIEVRTPSLAGYLDKDRIVSEISHNELTLSSSSAWADNITNMIGRVMMLNLAQRLPNARIFLQNQATETKPQVYVEMDISKFNQDASGKAVMTTDLVIRDNNDKPARFNRLLTLEKIPETKDVKSLVMTLSQLLGLVADTAAMNLTNIPDYHRSELY